MALRKQTWGPRDEPDYDEDRDQRHIPMSIAAFEAFIDLPQTDEHAHYELIDGVLYNMAPPSPEHQIISLNLASLLQGQLPKGPCRVIQDIYVKVDDKSPSMRPDILLTCVPSDYHPAHRAKKHHRVRHPRLVVEILSTSTKKMDRGEKFQRYQASKTLEVYLLVHQAEALVEVYPRSQDWLQHDYRADEHLALQVGDLQFNLDVNDIYAGLYESNQS